MEKKKTENSVQRKSIYTTVHKPKSYEKTSFHDLKFFYDVLQIVKKKARNIKLNRRIVETFLLVVILVVPLGVVGFFGFSKFKEYQQNQTTKEQQYQDKLQASLAEIAALRKESEQRSQDLNQKLERQLEQQQQLKQETQQKLTEAQLDAQRKIEQARLEAQQETERQAQIAQQKAKELEEKLSKANYNLSDIVREWSPIMARIRCGPSSGSGTVKMDSLKIVPIVMTNRHVLLDYEGYAHSYRCEVTIPNVYQVYHFYTEDTRINSSYDFAEATIVDADINLRNTILTHSDKPNCFTKPSIGEEVVILGYPGIGSQYTVTATEGIISGYDNTYFITSAKIAHGNSGGAAILTKKNCFLGIPTRFKSDNAESLAQILDINSIPVF